MADGNAAFDLNVRLEEDDDDGFDLNNAVHLEDDGGGGNIPFDPVEHGDDDGNAAFDFNEHDDDDDNSGFDLNEPVHDEHANGFDLNLPLDEFGAVDFDYVQNLADHADQVVQPKHDYSDNVRQQVYQALLMRSKNGRLGKHDTTIVSEQFGVKIRTVQRIWKRGKNQLAKHSGQGS
ncbi:uncharacterized protein LOC120669177 [Panicum virgatum]|uniref:uncharacterized protein LOC120669177 n=1 Tax=Panicum virgatum TaxID=38727 RepID=UPI0019D52A32|nr:uncharacterized protein LOC120669177 [Panicum virgatum]